MADKGDTRPILAIYDVSGIQEYIFSTSRLRENTGASLIVRHILKEELPEAIREVGSKLDGDVFTEWESDKPFQMKSNPQAQVEVIYNGGGSAVVAYRKKEAYDEVNIILAKRLIQISYTLTLATTCLETDFENYSRDRAALALKLEEVKERLPRQRPMGSFPIVEQESLTGWPITQRDIWNQDISTVQALKRQAAEKSKERDFQDVLPSADVSFAIEMEDLRAEKGEDSFVAVVHLDGNDMGRILQEKIAGFEDYQHSVGEMRKLSKAITDLYRDIFKKLVKEINDQIKDPQTSPYAVKRIGGKDEYILPIRPLILDGDDITFICTGRLGIALAAAFLRRLASTSNAGFQPSACAGVALVPSHFPFNIAYEMAESCCSNAKARRRKLNDTAGYLDFHIGHGAHIKDVPDWREEEYGGYRDGYSLLKRPYRIPAQRDEEHQPSFDRLDSLLANPPFGAGIVEGKDEVWPRSRLKALYEAYRTGPEQVAFLLEELASRGHSLPASIRPAFDEQGETYMYDALELMDLYERGLFQGLTEGESAAEGGNQ